MKKARQFFERNAQQSIMGRVSSLPVISRTGPNEKSAIERGDSNSKVFVVGVSKVDGKTKIGGR